MNGRALRVGLVVLGAALAGVAGTVLWRSRMEPETSTAALPAPAAVSAPDDLGTPETWDWPVSFQVPADASPAYERVVLVTLDTLRADHVSSYGYARKTTPFFDSLAERGVLFERAIAAASSTAPSHTSLLTGLPPALHGVALNGHEIDVKSADLARLFKAADFDTAAFLNVSFLKGVARSFRHVDVQQLRGGPVVDAAIAWLAGERRSERFFVWVHLFDPHHWKDADRTPAAELAEIRAGTTLDDDELYDYLAKLHGFPALDPGRPFELPSESGARLKAKSPRDYLDYIDAYDAQILYADRQLERLVRAVEGLALPGRTLWVVTADHGEGLASHGVVGHGSRVYQEQLRIPLLVAASDGSLGPRRVKELVQHVDLFPTLAATIGAGVRGQYPELLGSSLWPLIERGEGRGDLPAFSQRHAIAANAIEERESRPKRRRRAQAEEDAAADEESQEMEELYALQTQRYKLILHGADRNEFYDLEADPLELEDRAADASSELEELRRLLERRLELLSARPGRAAEPEIQPEFLEELRDLGYVR